MLDTARVLATQPVPAGPRVAVLTNSRSPRSSAEAALAPSASRSSERPPPRLGAPTPDDFAVALRGALADDDVDAVIVIHAPPLAEDVAAPVDEIDEAAGGATKPVARRAAGRRRRPAAAGVAGAGVRVPRARRRRARRALACTASGWRREAAAESGSIADIDRPLVAGVIAAASTDGGEELGVVEAARRARARTGSRRRRPTRRGGGRWRRRGAAEIGYPVAVKALHRHLGRSVEAGVGLDLVDAEDVAATVASMRRSIGDDAAAVIVQRMATPGLDLRITQHRRRTAGRDDRRRARRVERRPHERRAVPAHALVGSPEPGRAARGIASRTGDRRPTSKPRPSSTRSSGSPSSSPTTPRSSRSTSTRSSPPPAGWR